jgi:HD superfamily phosphodiesterase
MKNFEKLFEQHMHQVCAENPDPSHDILQTNTLDHFFTKLLHLHSRLNTESAKLEGQRRLETMNQFLADLRSELS